MSLIFEPAIKQMIKSNCNCFGPVSFQDYIKENDLPKSKTAEYISIDSYEMLDKSLKENRIMVLRTGKALDNGIGTQFILVKVKELKDYFIVDNDVMNKESWETYLPTKSIRELFAYQVFPFLSETSYVNLGVASGLISHALGLDEYNVPLTPATGKSTFSFEFMIHSSMSNQIINHKNGQVEIDGVFVAKKDGKQVVFVLEAKSDSKHKSLSKHKLVYPILSIASKVPKDMPIIPIYMKIYKTDDGIHYHIIECEYPDPRLNITAIDELKVKKCSHLVLPIFELR